MCDDTSRAEAPHRCLFLYFVVSFFVKAQKRLDEAAKKKRLNAELEAQKKAQKHAQDEAQKAELERKRVAAVEEAKRVAAASRAKKLVDKAVAEEEEAADRDIRKAQEEKRNKVALERMRAAKEVHDSLHTFSPVLVII